MHNKKIFEGICDPGYQNQSLGPQNGFAYYWISGTSMCLASK